MGAHKVLRKAMYRAMEGAGTLPAKESVKIRPADWHALEKAVAEAAALIDSLVEKMLRVEADRDERWKQAEIAEARLAKAVAERDAAYETCARIAEMHDHRGDIAKSIRARARTKTGGQTDDAG